MDAREEGHGPACGPDQQCSAGGVRITLLYVRPPNEEMTELDRRVEAIAERYSRWVELRVVGPTASSGMIRSLSRAGTVLAGGRMGDDGSFSSPALLLLRQGEVVGEAMGALLPMRELDDVVRRAVEWPAPPPA
jgi:hypothetical protein